MKAPLSVIVLSAGFSAAVLLTGCDSSQKTNKNESKPVATESKSATHTTGWPHSDRAGNLNWTTLAYPTGDSRTSALGIEKGVPREVRVGQPFDYELIVTNLTGNNLDDVVVTEQLNNNYKLTSSTPEGKAAGNGVVTWMVGDMKPNESKTIRVTGTATGEGSISSCASCSYSSMLCSNIPVVSPKLRLTKTGPAEVSKCDEIAYNFEVTNTGSGTINNVKVTDSLPAGMTTADGKKSLDFAVGTLGAGQSKTLTGRVRAEKGGRYENKASATGEGGLVADSSLVATVVHQPVLTVKAECPGNQMIGRELTFKYTVKSTGDVAAAGTTVSAPIPAGTTFIRADNNGASGSGRVTWNIGTLNVNDSRIVSMTVRSTNAGAIQTTVAAAATCAAAANDACTTTVQGVPDIGTSIDDDDGVILVGDNHIFKYTIVNQGQVDLTNVKASFTLTDGLDFVSTNFPGGAKASGRMVDVAVGTVKPGQQVTFNVIAKGTQSGEQGISSLTSSNELKRTVRNDEQVTFVDR